MGSGYRYGSCIMDQSLALRAGVGYCMIRRIALVGVSTVGVRIVVDMGW